MKKKLPIVIIIISLIQLGMSIAYFLRVSDYGFKDNMSGYGLIFSGISFFILGFALMSEQNRNNY